MYALPHKMRRVRKDRQRALPRRQPQAGRGSASLWTPAAFQCGFRGSRSLLFLLQKTHRFIYYSDTGWAVGAEESDFEGWAFPFPGVTVIEDFVTREEEAEMVQLMDREPWKLSQSGRRKQVGLGRRGGTGWLVREESSCSRLLAPHPLAHIPPVPLSAATAPQGH